VNALVGAATQSVRPRNRFGFLLKPGWIGAIVGALAFTAACWLILAPWQFSRHSETAAANHAIDAANTATPVPVRNLLSTDAEPEVHDAYQPVTATGVFDPSHTFYVRLRQDNGGNPVSEVVLPMRLEDGSILLVDRGYRSFGDIDARVPLPPVPTGEVTVTGRVQQDQTDPAHRGPTTVTSQLVDGKVVEVPKRIEVHAVNADLLAGPDGTTGAAGNVLQGYIQLMAGSPGVLDEIGMPQTDGGPYFSYALQWCAFGAMSILAIAYFIFREATDPRGPDERNVAYPERARHPDGTGLVPEPPAGPDPTGGPGPPPSAAADDDGLLVSASTSVRPNQRRTKSKRPARDGFDRSQLFD
jgi:cytochrome oxidase assembly protein ShyY1